MHFSVLMSVYKNERADNFNQAVDSILHQTLPPDEIVLIRDGIVSNELQAAIDSYLNGPNGSLFSYYPLDKNCGLGNALKIGVEKAKYAYIARMDTDDIAIQNRFEIQINYMEKHPDISVCGGQICEFEGSIDNITGKREVPLLHKDISSFIKNRNPFNHMTVIFKKQDVISVGNYIELRYVEDYYLWCRMLVRGFRFANVPRVLVYARTNEDTYRRRGGYCYFQSWQSIEKFKLENGVCAKSDYYKTLLMRFIIQVLLPNSIRGFILKKFSRTR